MNLPQDQQIPNYGFDPLTVEGRLPQQGQQGQGPTYGDERKRQAEESMKVDRAPVKIQRTEESRADGHRIETTSNGDAKHVKKFGPDGKVISVKITTNDASNDPINGQGPLVSQAEAEQGPYVPLAEAERGAYPFVGPQQEEPFVGPLQEDGGPIPGPAQGASPFVGPRQEDGGPIPGPAPAQVAARQTGPARFEAPRRDWSTMDWTPVRKLTDDIYGTNIAEGSVDPYVAVYKRAVEEFKLNNPGAGKGGKDNSLAWAKLQHSQKTDADKFQYRKDRDIEKDINEKAERDEKIRQWQKGFEQKQGNYNSLAAHRNREKGGSKDPRLQELNIRLKELGIEGKKLGIKGKKLAIRKAGEGTGVQQKAAGAARTLSLNAINARAAMKAGKDDGSFDPTDHLQPWNYRSAWNGPTKSDAAKRYQSASKAWTQERTRQVSGAVIRKDELIEETERFWPKPGDTPDIVADKINQRRVQEVNYWTIGYGSNTNLNPNAARNTQDVAARMRDYDEAIGLRPSTPKGGDPKTEARLNQLKKNKADRAKRKIARDKRRKELQGGKK